MSCFKILKFIFLLKIFTVCDRCIPSNFLLTSYPFPSENFLSKESLKHFYLLTFYGLQAVDLFAKLFLHFFGFIIYDVLCRQQLLTCVADISVTWFSHFSPNLSKARLHCKFTPCLLCNVRKKKVKFESSFSLK